MFETKRHTIPAAEEVLGKYFPVLDHGFVALTDYMGGDLAIEQAARCSYTIGEEVRDIRDTTRLLRYLFRKRHTSPFEMAEMKFHIGMPIFVMRQWVRHRTASMNEFSARYSVMPKLFYQPDEEQVCYQSSNNKQGRAGPTDYQSYGQFMINQSIAENHATKAYEWAIGHDISRETARISLPLTTYTYAVWKMDLKNLIHLIALRSDKHAQWEIRQYSDVVAGIVQRLCPITFDAFLDYQMTAVTFTQAELAAIRAMGMGHASPITWANPSPLLRSRVEGVLAEHGVSNREAREFWDKLAPIDRRDFNLNLSRARDASYYERLVREHEVEVPAA